MGPFCTVCRIMTILSRSVAIGANSLTTKKEHASRTLRKHNPSDFCRKIKVGIGRIRLCKRMTLRVVDERDNRNRVFNAEVIRVEDKSSGTERCTTDNGNTALTSQCRTSQDGLPLEWYSSHVA